MLTTRFVGSCTSLLMILAIYFGWAYFVPVVSDPYYDFGRIFYYSCLFPIAAAGNVLWRRTIQTGFQCRAIHLYPSFYLLVHHYCAATVSRRQIFGATPLDDRVSASKIGSTIPACSDASSLHLCHSPDTLRCMTLTTRLFFLIYLLLMRNFF